MDISEIRAAFIHSEVLADKIRSFRIERISRILAKEGPLTLPTESIAALHLVPLGFIKIQIDVGRLERQYIKILGVSGIEMFRYNFDGRLAFNRTNELRNAFNYTQVFRTGAIESVDAWIQGNGH